MTDRPILFSAPMVRALLAGTKTQTRRVLKPQPEQNSAGLWCATTRTGAYQLSPEFMPLIVRIGVGDRLWVRESWDFLPLDEPRPEGSGRAEIVYWADAERLEFDVPEGFNPMIYGCERFRPSIHMPRWASRLTLTVTDVRVQRLNEISEEDAIAEGIEDVTHEVASSDRSLRFWKRYRDGGWNGYVDTAIGSYASLWTEINGPGSWEANPWVVAYSFTVEHRNIDEVPHG